MSNPSQVAARRQLGSELQRYRRAASLTGREVADALGWHQSKVSRIEAARNMIRREDAAALLEVLEVPETAKDELLQLAEVNEGEPGSWRNSSRAGLTRRQQDFIALEASAKTIWHYQPVMLPGYLQTREYARRVVEMADSRDVERAVDGRLSRRQTLMSDSPPQYRILLMEAALLWRPCDESDMAEQLKTVADISGRGNVDLRVVRYDRTQVGFIQHPLMLLDFEEGMAPTSFVETTTQDFRVNDVHGLEVLRRHFNRIHASALSQSETRELIYELARSLG